MKFKALLQTEKKLKGIFTNNYLNVTILRTSFDHKMMKKAKNGAVFQTREEVEEEDHAR